MSFSKCFYCGFMVLFIWSFFASPAVSETDALKVLEKDPVKIDFNDVIEKRSEPSQNSSPSDLKIAVSAMISPKYTFKYYVGLLNLIGKCMDMGVTFVQKKTYLEVNNMLERCEVDLAFICSGPYVTGKAEYGMEIIAVPMCHGEKVYYSYFIAAKEGGIRCFEDLRGKRFAFTDPLSNTGFMVPAYYLAQRSETPETYFDKTFFTYSHDNSICAVSNGLADGAAVDSLIYEFMAATNPELTEKTVVVEKSPPYGIPPVVVTPSMTLEIKEKLKRIFFTIHEIPEGKTYLKNLQIDCFVEGKDEDYDTVRELQHFLASRQK